MKLKDKSGISSLLLVMVLAGVLMMLFVSMGNVFRSLNKSTQELKQNTAANNALLDIAQIVIQGYHKAKITSPPNPPGCDPSSVPRRVGTTSTYLCLPTSYCTQYGVRYCIANPPQITKHDTNDDERVYVLNKRKPLNSSPIEILIAHAHAAPPSPWLPDVDTMTPPTLTITSPDCTNTTGTQKDCIRCNPPNQNADCIKIRVCTNNSSTCPNAANYIEPVFAIQTSYN